MKKQFFSGVLQVVRRIAHLSISAQKSPYSTKETLVLYPLIQYTEKEQLVRKYISVDIRKRVINTIESDHNSNSVFLLYYHLGYKIQKKSTE